jgi:hypothetical protein
MDLVFGRADLDGKLGGPPVVISRGGVLTAPPSSMARPDRAIASP